MPVSGFQTTFFDIQTQCSEGSNFFQNHHMPFCIQAGDVEGFDVFDGDGVGEFGDFFFGVHAFHGDPATTIFQQVCRPIDHFMSYICIQMNTKQIKRI